MSLIDLLDKGNCHQSLSNLNECKNTLATVTLASPAGQQRLANTFSIISSSRNNDSSYQQGNHRQDEGPGNHFSNERIGVVIQCHAKIIFIFIFGDTQLLSSTSRNHFLATLIASRVLLFVVENVQARATCLGHRSDFGWLGWRKGQGRSNETK
jgi:hypothetical protein